MARISPHMRRVVIPELLDTDSGTPKEVRASLGDLRRINRWFGGSSTTRLAIEKVADSTGQQEFSLLDVAAGSGDVPLNAARELSKSGIQVRVTLMDRASSHISGYRRAVIGDALALPFRENSFDIVSCSLFAHHLEPPQLQEFVEKSLRVARLAVIINDLRRSLLHLALIYAGLPLFRSRLTRHDARASVKRAYTPQEFKSLVGRTQAQSCNVLHHYLFRVGVIAWKSGTLIPEKYNQLQVVGRSR